MLDDGGTGDGAISSAILNELRGLGRVDEVDFEYASSTSSQGTESKRERSEESSGQAVEQLSNGYAGGGLEFEPAVLHIDSDERCGARMAAAKLTPELSPDAVIREVNHREIVFGAAVKGCGDKLREFLKHPAVIEEAESLAKARIVDPIDEVVVFAAQAELVNLIVETRGMAKNVFQAGERVVGPFKNVNEEVFRHAIHFKVARIRVCPTTDQLFPTLQAKTFPS